MWSINGVIKGGTTSVDSSLFFKIVTEALEGKWNIKWIMIRELVGLYEVYTVVSVMIPPFQRVIGADG